MAQTKITNKSIAQGTILDSNIADNTITGNKIASNFNISNKTVTLPSGCVTGAAGGGVLNSSAIGSQTLLTEIADNDQHLVLDDTDNNLKRVRNYDLLPTGSVIQTLSRYLFVRGGTNSSSFITYISLDFTPKRANSLIVLRATVAFGNYSGGFAKHTIFRQLPNVTEYNLLENLEYRNPISPNDIYHAVWPGMIFNQADYSWENTGDMQTIECLDRPNTTQTITYNWKYAGNGGSHHVYVGASYWYYANAGYGTGGTNNIWGYRVGAPTYVEIREIKQ
jgi:hypothetical protein